MSNSGIGWDHEERFSLPLHLGKGCKGSRKQRSCPRVLPPQPPSSVYGKDCPRHALPQPCVIEWRWRHLIKIVTHSPFCFNKPYTVHKYTLVLITLHESCRLFQDFTGMSLDKLLNVVRTLKVGRLFGIKRFTITCDQVQVVQKTLRVCI